MSQLQTAAACLESAERVSDLSLLQSIALCGDQNAFAQLYERYHQDAFNLSFYITRDWALAEEAVQEALLSIWRFAKDYQTGDNARPWIMRIVARRSVRMAKRESRQVATLEPEQMDWHPSKSATHTVTSELSEAAQALRRILDSQPALDRQLVALYYGAGLSQQQIANELDMPRRTIATRLQKVLDRLRLQLTAAGCACALPLLQVEGLGDAICRGWSAPQLGMEGLLAKLGSPGRCSTRRLAAESAVVSSKKLAWLSAGAAAILAVAVGAAVLTAPKEKTASPVQEFQAKAEPRSDALALRPIVQAQSLSETKTPAPSFEPWHPYPIEPGKTYALFARPEFLIQHRALFDINPLERCDWIIHAAPAGTDIQSQTSEAKVFILGACMDRPQEISGQIEYTSHDSSSELGFFLADPSLRFGVAAGAHKVGEMGTCPLRIFTWLESGEARILTLRKLSNGINALGKNYLESKDQKYALGFIAPKGVAIRDLKVRNLPLGWTLSHNPELEQLVATPDLALKPRKK